jgi:hypothetical protein
MLAESLAVEVSTISTGDWACAGLRAAISAELDEYRRAEGYGMVYREKLPLAGIVLHGRR